MSINSTSPTTFELHFTQIPTKTIDETREVTLQIFGTVIPGMAVEAIEAMWMGTRGRKDSSGAIDFQDWTVNFLINNDFSNWKIMHDWMKYIAEVKIMPSEHNIKAILVVRNNFGGDLMYVHFSQVWLQNLGEVTFNTQSGEEFLQCTATIDYIRYDVIMPGESIEG